MKKTIEEIRQENLKALLEDRFNNNIPDLSKAIGRAQSTISKYLSKSQSRKINDSIARSIERSLEQSRARS